METKKNILEQIEKGLEIELLDKLNSYVVKDYDKRSKNLIKILIILQEHARVDWVKPNQALVNIIVKFLPEILESNESLEDFITLISDNASTPYENISYLCRQFVIGIQDNDPLISNIKNTNLKLSEFQNRIKELNVIFLSRAIDEKLDHIKITTLMYNCVDHLEDERRIIIQNAALIKYREYLTLFPEKYLQSYIRPYFSGINRLNPEFYLHVAEPFYLQIFTEEFSFDRLIIFAKELKVNELLIDDILNFQMEIDNYKGNSVDKQIMLFSKEMYSDSYRSYSYKDPESYLKLKSDKHLNIRKECLPPNYEA